MSSTTSTEYLWFNQGAFNGIQFRDVEIVDILESLEGRMKKLANRDPLFKEHEEKHSVAFPQKELELNGEGLLEIRNRVDNESKTQRFSAKLFSRDDHVDGAAYDDILFCYKRQIMKTANLNHPHLMRNLLLLDTGRKFFVVREFPEGGSIADLIQSWGFITEQLAQRYFKQVVSAVWYLHSNGVIHGNINCQNILIDKDNNAKLSSDVHVKNICPGAKGRHFNVGPMFFRAPELWKRKSSLCRQKHISLDEDILKHLMKKVYKMSFNKYVYCLSDVWSLGVVLFIMLWGKAPYTIDQYNIICKGVYIRPVPQLAAKTGALTISAAAERLYTKMLVPDINLRIRPLQVLNDVWTQSDKWTDNNKKFNLPCVTMKSQSSKLEFCRKPTKGNSNILADVDLNPEEIKDEYYATFIPADIDGGGWMSAYDRMIFSAKQKETNRRLISGISKPSGPLFPCYMPDPDNSGKGVSCRVIWLQSECLRTDPEYSIIRVHPVLGLIGPGQLHHAVLHRISDGKVVISNPKYALLLIHPSMIKGLEKIPRNEEKPYRGPIPQSFEEPNVLHYLLSTINKERRFSSEFRRLTQPLLDSIRPHIQDDSNKKPPEKIKFPNYIRRAIENLRRGDEKVKQLDFCKISTK